MVPTSQLIPAQDGFPRANRAEGSGFSFVPSRNHFFVILGVYFLLHLMLRTLVSETAGIDEADQLVRGQHLGWGYGPQAPLYTWLMTLFLKTFGYSIFSLTLLRELILFGIYLLTYLNGKVLTGSHVGGVIAAAALQFHHSIVWESQRELTHSLPASLFGLATILAFQKLSDKNWWSWLALGLCAGLAIISKYNAALLWIALLASALFVPSFRPRVLNPRILISLAVSLLLALPSASWALTHQAEAASSMYKFGIQQTAGWLPSVLAGLREWFQTLAAHLLALTLIMSLLFARPLLRECGWRLEGDATRWLFGIFLFINVAVIASIFVLKVTALKDRWLQPLLIWTPLFFAVWLQPHFTPRRIKMVLGLSLAIALIVVVGASGRLLLTDWRGRRDVLNAPFREFATDLSGRARSSDCFVTGGYWLGGNLILWFPEKPIHSVDLAPPVLNSETQTCLVIWDATKRIEPPENLIRFAAAFGGKDALATPQVFEHKWKYQRAKTMRLAVVSLKTPSRSP